MEIPLEQAARRLPTLTGLALAAAVLLAGGGCLGGPRVLRLGPETAPEGGSGAPSELQRRIAELKGPARIELEPGAYHLVAVEFEDASCANCEDPTIPSRATRGLLVRGRGIEIVGGRAEDVVIHTHAGYGIFFDGCDDCSLSGVTVTSGTRDWIPEASDGGIVVRQGAVRISDCVVRDNLGDEEAVKRTVAGIAGIVGREGARLTVEQCRILRNSWDGIALYRGSRGTIRGNVIDGVDARQGDTRRAASGGRGAGIGLTWDAEGQIEGNLIQRYWKGIGIFVDARAELRHNIVEDVLTWGINLWDGGQGAPGLVAEGNVVHSAGACGASLRREAPLREGEVGRFVGNVLTFTGREASYDDPARYCAQVALDEAAVPSGFVVEGNLRHGNRGPGGAADAQDLDAARFSELLVPLYERLRQEPALADAEFLRVLRPK